MTASHRHPERWGGLRRAADRRSAAQSLCLRLPRLLSWIIEVSQRTALGPLVTPQTMGPSAGEGRLRAGLTEFADGPRFFEQFGGALKPSQLSALNLLDLGCGYGGRTVYYATRCGAAHVVGVEPFESLVSCCRDLAKQRQCTNATFEVGSAEALPFSDESFDGVVSFDVLEHVHDPAMAFTEVRRVLRPSGRAWLVFPTYRGARASHLDFITRVPALHRIFDPDTIVSVVNAELARSDGRYGLRSVEHPTLSSLGYLTRPDLNGLTRPDALRLISDSGLRVERECALPFVRATDPIPGARLVNRGLNLWRSRWQLPELLIGSLAYELSIR
jgi:SAM-dependent methyltransferase